MCAPFGALLYLLDCFVTLAMTVVLESLSLRASAATRGNPVYFMLRVAHKIFIAAKRQRRRMNFIYTSHHDDRLCTAGPIFHELKHFQHRDRRPSEHVHQFDPDIYRP